MQQHTTIGTARRLLDLWASAWHHRSNLADGHPLLKECTNEQTDCPSPEKYSKRSLPRMNERVTSAIETVERALRVFGAPKWFIAYLLTKYPLVGKYASGSDAEDCVPRLAHGWGISAAERTPQTDRALKRLALATERAFFKRLVKEADNAPI